MPRRNRFGAKVSAPPSAINGTRRQWLQLPYGIGYRNGLAADIAYRSNI